MKKLTDKEINYLLPLFEHSTYPGWKSIATRLLKSGECVVAGDSCIWVGVYTS
jgi:hypothetical protein